MIPCPSQNSYLATQSLISVFLIPSQAFNPAVSISLSKCPMFPTIALFFIQAISLAMMMFLLPVVVMKISASLITFYKVTTSNPSIQAYKAQMGSTSVTKTLAPHPFKAQAHPFPTSPYPQTTAFLPAIITSVALKIPSGRECLHPQTLSNLDLVTESLTLMAGKGNSFFSANQCNLWTPVVVSSEQPQKSFNKFLNLLGLAGMVSLKTSINFYSSSVSYLLGSGKDLFFSYSSSHFFPYKIIMVASPPSSTKMLGPVPSGQIKAFKVQYQ